jgi:type IV pilus assembly protein PilZ
MPWTPDPAIMSLAMSEDVSGRERRRHVRVRLNQLIQYRFAAFDEFLSEYAADLSEGGMFIETDEPRALGDTISVQFALRDGTRLVECLAHVIRVEPPGSPCPGMAVAFRGLDPESLALLKEIIVRTQDLEPR